MNGQQLAGSHEVVELTSNLKVGAFSNGEKCIRGLSQMGNLLGEKIEGNLAASS